MSKESRQVIAASIWPFIYIILLWVMFGAQQLHEPLGHGLALIPRNISQWWGPFTFPLVHGDAGHLFWNSMPLIVLGTTLWFFYRGIAAEVVLWIWLMSGIWTWIFARPSYHIGSSGIIYGLATFIIFSGAMRKNRSLLTIGLLMVFLYGSMVWGLFPVQPDVSWEGHLSGALAGVMVAWFMRKRGPADEQPPRWDDDPDDDEYPYWLEGNDEIEKDARPVVFRYRYKSNTGLDN